MRSRNVKHRRFGQVENPRRDELDEFEEWAWLIPVALVLAQAIVDSL